MREIFQGYPLEQPTFGSLIPLDVATVTKVEEVQIQPIPSDSNPAINPSSVHIDDSQPTTLISQQIKVSKKKRKATHVTTIVSDTTDKISEDESLPLIHKPSKKKKKLGKGLITQQPSSMSSQQDMEVIQGAKMLLDALSQHNASIEMCILPNASCK